jgi:hypothetical protein
VLFPALHTVAQTEKESSRRAFVTLSNLCDERAERVKRPGEKRLFDHQGHKDTQHVSVEPGFEQKQALLAGLSDDLVDEVWRWHFRLRVLHEFEASRAPYPCPSPIWSTACWSAQNRSLCRSPSCCACPNSPTCSNTSHAARPAAPSRGFPAEVPPRC